MSDASTAMSDAREQFSAAFKSVQVAMRRMRGRQTHHHNGLSYAQYGLLFSLEQGCALSARELGEAASLSPASVTQMLESLESGGLVERHRSADDKRVVLTQLTDKGRDAIAEMRARTEPAWRAALSHFTDGELQTAAAVLESLADYFTRLADEPDRIGEERSDAVSVGRDHAA